MPGRRSSILRWTGTGHKEAITASRALPGTFKQGIRNGLIRIAKQFAARAALNAPYQTGNLASSIFPDEFVWRGKSGSITVGTHDVSYALHRHEVASRKVYKDGSTPEGGRGAKYLTRVAEARALTNWPTFLMLEINAELEDLAPKR